MMSDLTGFDYRKYIKLNEKKLDNEWSLIAFRPPSNKSVVVHMPCLIKKLDALSCWDKYSICPVCNIEIPDKYKTLIKLLELDI